MGSHSHCAADAQKEAQGSEALLKWAEEGQMDEKERNLVRFEVNGLSHWLLYPKEKVVGSL